MSFQNFVIKQVMLRNKRKTIARTGGKIRSVPKARRFMDKMLTRYRLAEGVIQEAVTVNSIPAEWHTPDSFSDKVILYLHGGGYFVGSLDSHRSVVSKIAKECKTKALAIDYRLAPEHPYPAAIEDVVSAFDWLQAQGYPPEKVIFMGDSAGGGLSLATCLHLRDEGSVLPGAMVLISPWADLTATSESCKTKSDIDPLLSTMYLEQVAGFYAGERQASDPGISPVFADMSNLCPTLIQVGTDEILLDDSLTIGEKMKAAGVKVTLSISKGGFHVYHVCWPHLPEARKAIKEISQFLEFFKPVLG